MYFNFKLCNVFTLRNRARSLLLPTRLAFAGSFRRAYMRGTLRHVPDRGPIGVLSLGAKTHSGVPVSDRADPGDNTGVLGDVAPGVFRAPTGVLVPDVDYTYLGVARAADGRAVGFVASSGFPAALVYTVFVPAGANLAGLSLTVFPRRGVDATQWDLGRATPLDATAPAAPSVGTVMDDAGPVTGAVAADAPTDDATPTVTVSFPGNGALAGDTVRLLADGVQVGAVVLSQGDVLRGSVGLTASALSGDGAKRFTATVTDAAGNASAPSAAVRVVLDTAAPGETTTVRLASDTGGSATDGITSDPALAGTVSNGAAGHAGPRRRSGRVGPLDARARQRRRHPRPGGAGLLGERGARRPDRARRPEREPGAVRHPLRLSGPSEGSTARRPLARRLRGGAAPPASAWHPRRVQSLRGSGGRGRGRTVGRGRAKDARATGRPRAVQSQPRCLNQ